ncbi:MAG: hypothetical protein WDA29_10985 [Flavobacteriaceae bacterium]
MSNITPRKLKRIIESTVEKVLREQSNLSISSAIDHNDGDVRKVFRDLANRIFDPIKEKYNEMIELFSQIDPEDYEASREVFLDGKEAFEEIRREYEYWNMNIPEEVTQSSNHYGRLTTVLRDRGLPSGNIEATALAEGKKKLMAAIEQLMNKALKIKNDTERSFYTISPKKRKDQDKFW